MIGPRRRAAIAFFLVNLGAVACGLRQALGLKQAMNSLTERSARSAEQLLVMPRRRFAAALSALAKAEAAAAPRVERLPKRPRTTTSETYNRHTYEERRFLRLRRRGRGDASFDDAATTGAGGTGGGRSNNRNASPDIAVKAVEDSQKR